MTGRRWLTACALALVATMGMAGCAQLPEGVDGKLADAWTVPAEPKGYTPQEGACYVSFALGTASVRDTPPVDCSQEHESETLFAGDVPASQDTPMKLYAFCEQKVNAALGRDWRDFRLEIDVVRPTAAAMKAGAAWVRCDARELKDIANERTVRRTGRIKDGLAKLALGCFQTINKDYELAELACAQRHNTEYIASFTGGSEYPTTESQWAPLHRRCQSLTAKYLGISEAQMTARYSNLAGPMSNAWDKGERGVRCFLYLGKTKMTGSAKGKGASVPRFS